VNFAVTVDLVVLTIREERLCVLTVQRGIPPFKGALALPGGFVLDDEGLDDAAERELEEETGLGPESVHLEQLMSYGDPGRDPRQRVVTVAYLALAPELPDPEGGSDAASAQFVPVDGIGPLAFDHDRILADGVERARGKLEYTPLAAAFCKPPFTVAELRQVYETVWGAELDPRNFHRKVTGTPGFLEPVGDVMPGERGRPAQRYRAGTVKALYPPMLRP
jgi:8-oxo-dGTP diphosphatase